MYAYNYKNCTHIHEIIISIHTCIRIVLIYVYLYLVYVLV